MTYGFQQLLESWIGSQRLEARIVSSQEGIVDKATIDCDGEPMKRARGHAGSRVAFRKKPRKDVARVRYRFDVGRYSRQRVVPLTEKGMREELRDTRRDRFRSVCENPSNTVATAS